MGRVMRLALVLGAALVLAGCGNDTGSGPPPSAPQRLEVLSPAIRTEGDPIPRRFTCDGEDVSPRLSWSAPPVGAKEFAVLVEDPDAPGGSFVHWSLWGLPPESRGIAEKADVGALAQSRKMRALAEGANGFGDQGYSGPCPPKGDGPHRYRFLVYALSRPLGLESGAAAKDVREAIGKVALARGAVTGTYER
jgi:hypothetical protein